MSEHTSQGYEQGEPSGLVFSGTNDNTSLHPYTGQWMAHWMQACKSWSSKECEKYHNTVRVGNKVEQFKGHECLAVEPFNSKEIKHLCLDLNQSYVSECKGHSSSTVGDLDLIPHVLHSGETVEHNEIMFSNSQKLTESFIKWKSAASYLFQNLDDFGSKNTHFPMFDINGKIETIMDSREESYYHDAMLDKSPVSSSLADLAPSNNCLIGNTENAARFYDFFQPDLGCKCQKRKDTASCTFSCGPAFKVSANTELSCRQHESCCCSSSNKFISKGSKQNNDSVSRSFEISWTSPKDGSSHALQESSSNHFPCHFPTEKHDEMGLDRRQIEVMTGGTAFTQVKKIAFSETFTTRHYYSDKETATGPFENCTSEENRRGHGGIGTHFTGINNQPSTSADTLYHNPFHRTSSTLGETFSRPPKSAASASQAQEASCRSADNGISGRSEPPASTERATEDAAGQFFLCIKKAGISDSTLLQNNASESESCSRWVKRLRHKPLSTDWFQTCDGSSSEVQNRCLEEKSIPLSDNNNPSSTDTEEALQPLIRNRRRNGRRPVAPVTFLPVNGKKFASIQAMALMGNLIKNYKPCKFQRKEASVIWTV